jgi:Fe-S cluster biogenesis protein NfuA
MARDIVQQCDRVDRAVVEAQHLARSVTPQVAQDGGAVEAAGEDGAAILRYGQAAHRPAMPS